MRVIKKDNTIEEYNEQKIINAVNKAAERAMISLTNEDYQQICNGVWETIVQLDLEECEIYQMHNIAILCNINSFNFDIAAATSSALYIVTSFRTKSSTYNIVNLRRHTIKILSKLVSTKLYKLITISKKLFDICFNNFRQSHFITSFYRFFLF